MRAQSVGVSDGDHRGWRLGVPILWVYCTTHNSHSDLMEQIVVVVYLIGP